MSDTFSPLHSLTTSLAEADRLGGELRRDRLRERRFGYVICGAGFLIPKGVPSEVVTNPPIHQLPWLTSCIRGFFNQRGNVLPVFDLSPLFHRDMRHGVSPYLLTIDSGERGLALVIDELPFVLSCIPVERSGPLSLPEIVAGAVQRAFTGAGRTWFEVDHLVLYRSAADAVLN